MSEAIRIREVDRQKVFAYIPGDAFERAGVRPDGQYATQIGDEVRIDASPGTAKSIAWLAAHATDDDVAPHVPIEDGRADEGVIWALSSQVASHSFRHPNATSKPYPEIVWSDAVALALKLSPELWRRMEVEAKVAEPTWQRAARA